VGEDYRATVRVLDGRVRFCVERVSKPGVVPVPLVEVLTPHAMDALCMAWVRYRMGAGE
jgi:hypothetical protein